MPQPSPHGWVYGVYSKAVRNVPLPFLNESLDQKNMNNSIGIVGAGIAGRLLAWQLLRRGYAVTLFERDVIDKGEADGLAAAYTAAGMLAPLSEADSAELPIVEMGLRSLALWPQLVNELNMDVDYHQTGSLIVAHPNDRADLLDFQQRLNRTVENLPKEVRCAIRPTNNNEIAGYEPELAERFQEATFIEGEAWLSSQATMSALAKRLIDAGCVFVENTSVKLIAAQTINTREKTWSFDAVCDCRGLGAKADMPNLRGVRGETIIVRAPEVTLKHLVRLMHPRYRIYIVPRKKNVYVIGATQIESASLAPITVRSTLELLSAAYAVHPGFAEASILDMRVNCRPAFPDNLPKIECEPGLLRINGLFRHGFLLAPAIVDDAIAQLDVMLAGKVINV